MSIRQRFRLNAILTIGLVVILITLFFAYELGLEKNLVLEQQAEQMLYEFISLSITTEGYIHHNELEKEIAWKEQISSFETLARQDTTLIPIIAEQIDFLERTVDNCQMGLSEQEFCAETTQEILLGISDLLHANFSAAKQESAKMLTRYRNLFIGYAAMAVVLLVVLSHENIARVLHPLDELLDGVKAIQRGYYDYRLPIDKKFSALRSKDELGSMAIAFNLMSADLEFTFTHLQQELKTNRQIMNQLQESERSLKRAEEIAHVGSWAVELPEFKMSWSDETFRIWGVEIDPARVTMEQIFAAVHPEDRQWVYDQFDSIPHKKEPFSVQYRVVRPGGEIRTVRQTVSIELDEQGEVKSTYGAMLDVTDYQKAMDDLRDREQLLRQVMDTTPNMIYLFDQEARLVMVNKDIADKYHTTPQALVGKTDADLVELGILDAETAARFQQDDLEVIQSQTTKFIPEEKLLQPNGSEIWLQTTLTPLNRPGQPPMGLGVSIDITERKRIEEEILAMNASLEARVAERTKELEHANEELRSFAYSISHDLRSPLRAIDGFSQILLDENAGTLSPQDRRYIQLLRENAVMMGKLIEGLLEFSRKGRQALNFQPVEPIDLVQSVLQDMSYEYPAHPAEVILGELPACTADGILLKQVFQNLISNAFKFSEKTDHPAIEIGSKIKDNQVIYFVKDNGVGFDMAYADRLFGVFQRLHRMDEFKGTGVGLAIVQRIIHRHGGEIWAESSPNNGACFFFTIPPFNENIKES